MVTGMSAGIPSNVFAKHTGGVAVIQEIDSTAKHPENALAPMSCKAMIHSSGSGSVIWDSLRLLTRAFFLSASPMLSQQQGVGSIGPYGRLTEDFLTLVEREYRNHRELDYYARRLNRNAKYLSRHIKEETGQTATDWIDKCVILDAEAQLLFTKQTILEISESLGFSSQSFFGKYFKRMNGVSPKKYRSKN